MALGKYLVGPAMMAALLAAPATTWALDPARQSPQDTRQDDTIPADEDPEYLDEAATADDPETVTDEDPAEALPADIQNEAGDAAARADEDTPYRAASSEEDDAVDVCAVAAEREAAVDGQRGRVRAIGDVKRVSNGWEVEGVVETGRGLLGLFRDETTFTCFARGGRAENVHIERDFAER